MGIRTKKPSYKTVIFDFDGTLANTLPQSLEVINELLGRTDDPITQKHIENALKGATVEEVAKDFGVRRIMLPVYLVRFRRKMKPRIVNTKPFDDIEPMLSTMYSRVQLGIISSNSTENVEQFLKNHGLLEYFDFVIGNVGLFSKARVIKKTIKNEQLKKKQVLYVGDEVRDIVASQKIKVDCAAVTWGPTPKSQLTKRKPTHLITKPKQLTKLLGL